MKKISFILLLFSNSVFAQVDTVNLKKIRFEGVFEPGLLFGKTSEVGVLPERADILLNNAKNTGTQVQFGIQMYLFNKIIIESQYTHDKFNTNTSQMVSEIKISNNSYFIQEEPKYGQVTSVSYGNYNINYWRIGIGGNFKLTKSKYLQPYAFYGIGKGFVPKGKFAFKDLSSNDFYINDYSFNSLKSSGYVVGIRYKYFADWNTEGSNRCYGDCGIKVEFSNFDISGKGNILKTDGYTKHESHTSFDFSKNYQYITVGVFCAIGIKGEKFKDNFLFSTYPIKHRKTIQEKMLEKKKKRLGKHVSPVDQSSK